MSLCVYTNGIRCAAVVSREYDPSKIVFVGNMRTLQNQDAAMFFVSEVFPSVKAAVPSAVFHIIGAEPPPFIQNLDDRKNIIVSGYVPSIEEAIQDAAVAVAPVRIAAGIQNKVLISMASGIPVVLTPMISAAIPELVSGENCLIADDSIEISEAVILFLKNTAIRNAIALSGYDLMKRAYSWHERLSGYELLDAVQPLPVKL
jgi:glycosyltransferase involved in cell wall biosynthesis